MEGHTLLSAFVSKHVAEEVQAAVAEARGAQGMLRDDVQEICLKILEACSLIAMKYVQAYSSSLSRLVV